MKDRLKTYASVLKNPAIAVCIGFLAGAVVIAFQGENILNVYYTMIRGAYGNAYYLTTTLAGAGPVMMCALAVAVSWRCGFSNMGIEGQMIWGGLIAAQVAVSMPGPDALVFVCSVAAGVLSAACYSLIAAWLYDKFKASLIITTLMLNYIAKSLSFYLVQYKWLDPNSADTAAVKTAKIRETLRLPRIIAKYPMHVGFLVAAAAVILFWWLFKNTKFGYESKMSGLNPNFARYGGINSRKLLYQVMLISGAVAGLGGALEVLGTRYMYMDGMFSSANYAWTGITAALMSYNHPVGIAFSSIFLYGIQTGCAAVQRSTSIPVEVASIIQGVITLLVTVQFGIRLGKRSKVKAPEGKAAVSAGPAEGAAVLAGSPEAEKGDEE